MNTAARVSLQYSHIHPVHTVYTVHISLHDLALQYVLSIFLIAVVVPHLYFGHHHSLGSSSSSSSTRHSSSGAAVDGGASRQSQLLSEFIYK